MPISPQRPTIDGHSRGGGVQHFYLAHGARRPPTVAHARGIHIWDSDGRCYIDASSGPVAMNIGHGDRRVLDAMKAQADKATFAFPFLFESEANLNLANALVDLLPKGLDRLLFVSGGSEAIEAAMKLARVHGLRTGAPQRQKFISRNPSYHGATLGAQSLTGDESMDMFYAAITPPAIRVPAPMSYRLPEGVDRETYGQHCADALEAAIVEADPETVLAFFMEPIGGLSTGASDAPDSYYLRVREICSRYGVLLVYDEVLTGLGRTGRFTASDHWPAARPDIMVLSKGLGAGYFPVGAVAAPAAMVECVAETGGFPYAQTYTATPLACATAGAVLKVIEEDGLVENSARMGEILLRELGRLRDRFPVIGDVRGRGLLQAMEFVADPVTREMLPNALNAPLRMSQIAAEFGLSFYPRRTNGGRFGDWLMMTPPLIIQEGGILDLVERLALALQAFTDELHASGHLKGRP